VDIKSRFNALVHASDRIGEPALSPSHVVLLGYYGHGNYGDDLMAWMIARHLGTEGISCSVFSLGDGPRDSLLVPDFVR